MLEILCQASKDTPFALTVGAFRKNYKSPTKVLGCPNVLGQAGHQQQRTYDFY